MVLFTWVKMHKWWSVKDSRLPLFEHRNNKVQTQPAFCSHRKEEITREFRPRRERRRGSLPVMQDTDWNRKRETKRNCKQFPVAIATTFTCVSEEGDRKDSLIFFLSLFLCFSAQTGYSLLTASHTETIVGFHGQRNCFHKRSKEVMQFP